MTPGRPPPRLRVAFVLAGLGRVRRGAETAFLELGRGLAAYPDLEVTLVGSGPDAPPGVRLVRSGCVPRERFERWPTGPVLRDDCCYEELTFTAGLLAGRRFRATDYDLAVHCSFPFTNWLLQLHRRRPAGPGLVFVTENGDWMCRADSREYRTFRCDGLVCTNPEYYDRHKGRYPAALIPNGVDAAVHRPRADDPDFRRDPRLPAGGPVVLVVSALIPSKRVADGVRAVAGLPGAVLVVAGDGPERDRVRALAAERLPGRHLLLGSVPRADMPRLYRQADVFLHPSQDEPSSIAYLEAAASGLPAVVHDAPVPRWTFADTAEYADTGDVPAVTAALRRAAANPGLGAAARRRVLDGWTWAALAARYRDFFYALRPGRRPAGAA